MAQESTWAYEKLDPETGKIEYQPLNDYDGKITGHIVFGVKQWFDENPDERIRLGWVKHIHHPTKDIEYNHQTQYLINTTRVIDEWTVEDVWLVMDKSEEMMRLEELTRGVLIDDDGIVTWG